MDGVTAVVVVVVVGEVVVGRVGCIGLVRSVSSSLWSALLLPLLLMVTAM